MLVLLEIGKKIKIYIYILFWSIINQLSFHQQEKIDISVSHKRSFLSGVGHKRWFLINVKKLKKLSLRTPL